MIDPLALGMNDQMPVLKDRPSDVMPQDQMQQPNIDETEVSKYVMEQFKNDVQDKEQWGWLDKREYDIRAYYGIKDLAMTQRPWPGASAYPVPITPTLLDTGWANIRASMRAPDGTMVKTKGVGAEDIRKAKPLEALLNWQVTNDIPMESVQDRNIFRTLLHGKAILKIIQDFIRNAVKVISFDIENFYLPIDAEGIQQTDVDHVTQIIPLSKSDIEYRKDLNIYENLDKMVPGARIGTNSQGTDQLMKLKDYVTGTNKEQRSRRETYFLAETYCEYRNKSASGYGDNGSSTRAAVKPVQIIVWWSPNGGTIHRIAMNPEGIRPFADYDLYPNPGYFFSMSLPEKLRNIQEKANYADKQNTDAMDRSISPAMFVDDTESFRKDVQQRVPGGIYSKGKGNTIDYEPQPPRERGFENQYNQMWIEARELTGLIDINQGAGTNDKTLGQTQIRSYRADIRFSSIFSRFERGWEKTVDLIYHFDNKFMPRDTKIKVVGYADYMSIDELFPREDNSRLGLGIEGKFDFKFAGAAVTEVEKEKQDKLNFYNAQLLMPDVMANPATAWKMRAEIAQASGIRDFETVMTKPKEVGILSAEEAIQRIVSGQTEIDIRPGIDTDSYIFEIQLFMKSQDRMSALRPECQAALMNLLRIANVMRAAQMQAMLHMQQIQQGFQVNQMADRANQQMDKMAQQPQPQETVQ